MPQALASIHMYQVNGYVLDRKLNDDNNSMHNVAVTRGVTFEQAASYRRVHVWAESASLDRKTLQSLWGEGDEVAIRHAEGFKVRRISIRLSCLYIAGFCSTKTLQHVLAWMQL